MPWGDLTKEKLAVRKLARDLASPTTEVLPYALVIKNLSDHLIDITLSGILVEPLTLHDKTHSDRIKKQAVEHAKKYTTYTGYEKHIDGSPEYIEKLSLAIAKSVQFSMDKLREVLAPQTRLSVHLVTSVMACSANGHPHRLSRIMVTYFNEKPYSVELVGAVIRQGSFVQKMYDLGWTKAGYFDSVDDELALQHALARYHAYESLVWLQSKSLTDLLHSFLDLLASTPASFFVPTLDIDLVWHTHQLMASKYKANCTTHVGRFIDQCISPHGLPSLYSLNP